MKQPAIAVTKEFHHWVNHYAHKYGGETYSSYQDSAWLTNYEFSEALMLYVETYYSLNREGELLLTSECKKVIFNREERASARWVEVKTRSTPKPPAYNFNITVGFKKWFELLKNQLSKELSESMTVKEFSDALMGYVETNQQIDGREQLGDLCNYLNSDAEERLRRVKERTGREFLTDTSYRQMFKEMKEKRRGT